MRDYLIGYFKHHKCKEEWIRFKTIVRNVVWNEKKKNFTVTACDSASDYVETFDYVIVCTGHLSTPNIPHFEGLDKFGGIVLHSHDLRAAEAYKDQTVVVVGRSYSAEDIASLLFKYGAKRIILTHRKGMARGKWESTGFSWPKGIEERPLMKAFQGNTVIFNDDSTVENVNAIIMCTGYNHGYPFIE